MVSRILSITLAFALVATASFAAGGSDSDDSAAAADKRYVTDPVTAQGVHRARVWRDIDLCP